MFSYATKEGNSFNGNDPYFKQTTLLLHGDGTNGAQNNTFLDSSTNNFTVTRAGNTTQGTFTPFSVAEGQWSNYFDGTGDYLRTPSSTSLDCAGDFTFECNFYLTATVADYRMFISNATSNNTYIALRSGGTGGLLQIVAAGAEQASLNLNNSVVPNTWNHIAVVRSGTTLTGYINGVSLGSATSSASFNFSNGQGTAIGVWGGGGNNWFGYLSNLRIVKGTAVYTANFTPSTTPLTAITNTSLLTCQSSRFVDNSSNNFTITRNGDVSVQPFSPFAPTSAYSTSVNGGSAYFDGSGDYLSVADNANLRFGTSAFTIQCWVYRNVAGAAHSIVSKGGASTGFTFGITSTNVLRFTDTTTNIDTTTTIPAGTWTHVAAVRTSTSANGFQLYINGVSSATSTVSTDFNQTDTLYAGADRSAANVMNGYIADLRYVNGTAETITVPTAPLTAVTNTALLLSGTNAGIFDNSTKNNLQTVGSAQVSTTFEKYGTGSMSFDGNGDYLISPYSPSIDLVGASFTIECWVYTTNLKAGGQRIFSTGGGAVGWSNTTGIHVLFQINDSSGAISLQIASGTATPRSLSSTATVSANTWTYLAAVFDASSNTIRLFINSTIRSAVVAAPSRPSTNPTLNIATIPGENGSSSSAFQGYIDDLRVTKGIARYSASFTPPTQAFPNQ